MESILPIHGISLGFPQQRNRSGKRRWLADYVLSIVNKRLKNTSTDTQREWDLWQAHCSLSSAAESTIGLGDDVANNERAKAMTLMTTNESRGVLVSEDSGFVTGICPAMQTLENVVAEIAPTSIPVLLVGESGTGKAMFARRVHRLSARSEEPLVALSCAAMNPAQLSSELRLNAGLDEHPRLGSAGSVIFDEISELDSACQRNLLYALPDGHAESRRGTLEARVISTTSRNLDDEMRAGRFRTELYYRINGVCLRLPALRDRREDIPILVESFLSKHAAQFGRPRPSLSPRTVRMLMEHSWPGNIRELENVVKKIIALGDEQIAVSELTLAPTEPRTEVPVSRGYSLKAASRAASREAEREMILRALAHTRWNRKRAAQELQISYKSLLYKLKQIGVLDSELG